METTEEEKVVQPEVTEEQVEKNEEVLKEGSDEKVESEDNVADEENKEESKEEQPESVSQTRVKVDGDFIREKYLSQAAVYWRDKLNILRNGLESDKEPPSIDSGKRKVEESVEDGWLLVD